MRKLPHAFPVRLSLTVLAVALVVFNAVATHLWGVGAGIPDATLTTLLALIGAAIAGDTLRPSGHVKAPPVDPMTAARIEAIAKRLPPPPAAPAAGPPAGGE